MPRARLAWRSGLGTCGLGSVSGMELPLQSPRVEPGFLGGAPDTRQFDSWRRKQRVFQAIRVKYRGEIEPDIYPTLARHFCQESRIWPGSGW